MASVGIIAKLFFPTKHASLGDVYEREETTQDEQLMTHLQRLKKQLVWFGGPFERFGDQIEALTEQFAAKVVLASVAVNQIHVFVNKDNECIIEEERSQWREVRLDALDQLHAILTIVTKSQIHLMWRRKMKLFKQIFQ